MKSLDTLKTLMAAAGILAVATLGSVERVDAASVSTCSETVAGKVSNTSECEVLDFGSGNPSQAQLDLLFAPGPGWMEIEKLNRSETSFTGGSFFPAGTSLTIIGNGESGTWSVLASLFDTYDRLMLVFKGPDGQSPAEPKGVVAYLLSANSGTYDTPFGNGSEDATNRMDISYVALYAQIPLPAAGWLLLGGLGALGFAARRKRKMVA